MSRGRRRAAATVGAAIVLLALGVQGWRTVSEARLAGPEVAPAATSAAAVGPPAEPKRASDAVRTDPPAAVSTATLTQQIAAPPLPPADTPLVQILPELEARARRGDRAAACRLALDGAYCREHRLDSDSVAFFEDAIARRSRTTAADLAWIARLEAAHQRALRLCSGLPPRWAEDNTWRWMLQAAQAGDALLAARFAAFPPLDDEDFLERPEPWQQYRQHAVPLLQSAAARGEVLAIWRLQRLHGAGQRLRGMPNAIERDPRQAAVYAVALQAATRGASLREFERAARAARARFSADDWAAIEQEGRALAQRHFAGMSPRDFQEGVFGEVDARHCQAE